MLRAAESGHCNAQQRVGMLHREGAGVDADSKAAFRWSLQAAEQGSMNAQRSVAIFYKNAEGCEKDLAKSVNFYRRAAEQGDAQSQHSVGVMLKHGHGTEVDLLAACRWHHEGAAQGHVRSAINLGNMYCQGLGVPRSPKTGYMWHRIAAEAGDAAMQERLRGFADCFHFPVSTPGMHVEVFGLTSEAGQKVNGRVGVVKGAPKPERAAVVLEGSSWRVTQSPPPSGKPTCGSRAKARSPSCANEQRHPPPFLPSMYHLPVHLSASVCPLSLPRARALSLSRFLFVSRFL